MTHAYAVRMFNKKRNGFNLDKNLELAMILEEQREGIEAETLAELVDAYTDLNYVWDGTKYKYAYNFEPIDGTMENIVLRTLDMFQNEIWFQCEELGINNNDLIDFASKIVDEINATKISKLDKNGKVMKQKDLRNATEEIQVYIDEQVLKSVVS